MADHIDSYLREVVRIHKRGNATEHSYRGALGDCMEGMMPDCDATNEPRQTAFGRPDYIITKKIIGMLPPLPIGYIEAKEINADLDKIENSDQIISYRKGFANFVLTDYLEFRFYRNSEPDGTVRIAELKQGTITPQRVNYGELNRLFTRFRGFDDENIGTWQKLAERMADAAGLIRDEVIIRAVDEKGIEGVKEQLEAFRKILIHDMKAEEFADIYAQTITYGLFTARFHDKIGDDFSREEARKLIPRSNPFLRKFFDYVCGEDLDDSLVWVVNYLCKLYRDVELHAVKKSFGKWVGRDDPLVHFYETFLASYNPKQKDSRGVFYTPKPVVDFIVNAVDDCLKKHFGLPEGLAHSGMVDIPIESNNQEKKSGKSKTKKPFHKVQLLDVATGTGTFMAEVIRNIYNSSFQNQKGAWSAYVEEHLLPRLHGFELLMAPYAMCHLKLDFLLEETGYRPRNSHNPPRLGVYLTNSLEEPYPDYDTLFAQWLSNESNEASHIKRQSPVMVAFGNPPYSGHSANQGQYAKNLIKRYKEGVEGLDKPAQAKWLSDDYVKFISLAEQYIAKNEEGGILAYITNHAYLDNPTFKGMRHHLLKTFDDIYIFDLHGSAKKREISPDGSADNNVFDIQQGVAIIIAIKHGRRKEKLAQVHHADLWGGRQSKYITLSNDRLKDIKWGKLRNVSPFYFFVPKNWKVFSEYKKFIFINDLFDADKKVNSSRKPNAPGIVTTHDNFAISSSKDEAINKVECFLQTETEKDARDIWKLCSQYQWNYLKAKNDLSSGTWREKICQVAYRPFDIRWTIYDPNVAVHLRDRASKHFLHRENVGLIAKRGDVENRSAPVHVSKHITESRSWSRPGMQGIESIFPLYLYEGKTRKPNFNMEIVKQIAETLKLPFIPDHKARGAAKKREEQTVFSPLDLLDYIYARLHSSTYREKYKEFLKMDFPRVPYPKNAKTFWRLADLGHELRLFHLMEHKALVKPPIGFPNDGSNKVDKPDFTNDGRVWINREQYFNEVPKEAWEFYIGGYQPAQKWLKDRKGRKLEFDDIAHYEKIITALTETHRIMKKIDKIPQ